MLGQRSNGVAPKGRRAAVGLLALLLTTTLAGTAGAGGVTPRGGPTTTTTTTVPETTTTTTTTSTTVPPTTAPPETTSTVPDTTVPSTTAPSSTTTPPSSTQALPTTTGVLLPTSAPTTIVTTTAPAELPMALDAMVMAAAVPAPAPTCSVAVELGASWMPGTSCLERRLTDLGYFAGGADDLFDGNTAAAVAAFQSASGLAADGQPRQATLNALGIWSRPAPTCTVAVDLGAPWMPGTACLETRLRQLGLFSGGSDDLFTYDTAVGVSLFQQSEGRAGTSNPTPTDLARLGIWSQPAANCTTGISLGAPWMPGTACLERRLRQLGLFSGSPDDLFTYDTAVGVSLYQQSVGRTGTGRPTVGDLVSLSIWRQPNADCAVSVRLGAPWMPGTSCLERRLAQLGLFSGTPDEMFDWGTAVGVSLYQQSVGANNTARPSVSDLQRLGIWSEPGSSPCKVRQVPRSTAPAGTTCLETRLAELGLLGEVPDETYDWNTAVAVSLYRQSIGQSGAGDGDTYTMTTLGILDDPNPLPGNSGSGRRVVYSRAQQRVWAVDDAGNVVKTHAVSGRTGIPRGGTYSVFSRSLYTYASGNPAVRWMYMIRFTTGPNGGNIGFHEIPKKNGVPLQGYQQLGLPLSAGCVRQATGDAQWMWNWAPVGTRVVVL